MIRSRCAQTRFWICDPPSLPMFQPIYDGCVWEVLGWATIPQTFLTSSSNQAGIIPASLDRQWREGVTFGFPTSLKSGASKEAPRVLLLGKHYRTQITTKLKSISNILSTNNDIFTASTHNLSTLQYPYTQPFFTSHISSLVDSPISFTWYYYSLQ